MAPSSLDLIAQAVDEELLYREALARGLDEHDVDIETRLVQKMMFLDEDTAGSEPLLRSSSSAPGPWVSSRTTSSSDAS